MNHLANYVGIGAGICTAVALMPQLLKIIHEKKAEDLSFLMLFIMMAGIAGWICYGIIKKDLPILFTNIFSLITNLLIIFFSIKYKKK